MKADVVSHVFTLTENLQLIMGRKGWKPVTPLKIKKGLFRARFSDRYKERVPLAKVLEACKSIPNCADSQHAQEMLYTNGLPDPWRPYLLVFNTVYKGPRGALCAHVLYYYKKESCWLEGYYDVKKPFFPDFFRVVIADALE